MDLKPVGIWTGQLDYQPANQAKEAVAELEELGYGAVWVGEAVPLWQPPVRHPPWRNQ
jgi:alkanesulfonate monooxygenase SsuD/methylene tetrahydromethanopterin reductase-like flavin-dependent oxidoreductase (luciferase family)